MHKTARQSENDLCPQEFSASYILITLAQLFKPMLNMKLTHRMMF